MKSFMLNDSIIFWASRGAVYFELQSLKRISLEKRLSALR